MGRKIRTTRDLAPPVACRKRGAMARQKCRRIDGTERDSSHAAPHELAVRSCAKLLGLFALISIMIAACVTPYGSAARGHQPTKQLSGSRASKLRGNGRIAVLNPVSSEVYTIASNRHLHPFLNDVLAFSWSRDGEHLAYITDSKPNRLYVSNALGGERKLLRVDNKMDSVAWAPSMSELAFSTSVHGYFDEHVFLIRTDGTGLHELAAGGAPSWAPDGKRIAFICGLKICVMRSDGKDMHAIASGVAPQWSPDGSHIAFQSVDLPRTIYTIEPDGQSRKKLAFGFSPAWSPDGTRVAFLCCAFNPANGDVSDVVSINVQNGRRVRLASKVRGIALSWQLLRDHG